MKRRPAQLKTDETPDTPSLDPWSDDQQRIYWEKEERITGRKIKE